MTIPRNLGNLAQGADANGVLGVTKGGTGATSNAAAPFALKGTNADITSLTGLTTPLSVGQGGTGAATLTANNVLLGNGTSALQTIAPGTTGNILTSNGATWTSSAPGGTAVGTLQYFSSGARPDSSWLVCDGTVYNKSSYTSLSTAIGNLPNYFSATTNNVIVNGSQTISIGRVVTDGTAYYAAVTYNSCGAGQLASKSTTGAVWSGATVSPPGIGCVELQYLNSLFFAIMDSDYGGTNALKTSPTFSTWTTRSTGAGKLRTVRYLNTTYVTAGDSGYLATSTDASTWTSQTTGTASAIYGLAYGNGVYVYVGASGVCASSTNLTSWTARTSGTSNNLTNLIFANGKFYAIGSLVTCISTDGITWTAYATLNSPGTNAVIYGYGNNFYYTGYAPPYGNTYWSSDGIGWGTYVAYGTSITAKTSELLVAYISDPYLVGATYNPFTYTVSTQFAIPSQTTKSTNQTGVTKDGNYNLFIKAT